MTGVCNTLRNLQGIVDVTLYVPADQKAEYAAAYPGVEIIGHKATGISQTRKALAAYHSRKYPTDPRIIMMDDDLRFYTRRKDDAGKFTDATKAEITAMFAAVGKAMYDYALVGITSREGGNNVLADEHNTRTTRFLAYNLDFIKQAGAKFGRIELMEDFDMQLQLSRAGYSSILLHSWAQGQKDSGAPGGCSTYRTPELQAACAHQLAAFHPGFVKVVEKTTKTSFGGGTRVDVQVSWKKAYASSHK